MARVLVTGAAGFVGRHLAALCAERGDEVIGVGRRSEAEARPVATDRYIAADLTDPGAARSVVEQSRPDRVFHLAASASVGESWDAPAATVRNNLDSTGALLEAIRTQAPQVYVLAAGSAEVYGAVASGDLPVTEDWPLRPRTPYGVSKAAADLLAGFYADAHGMSVVRARAFNHTGPGQGQGYVTADLARQIAAAEGRTEELEIVTGDLSARRDFSDVRDVVRAYVELIDAPPGAYNVCRGTSTSIAEILAGLASHSPLALRRRVDPDLLRPSEVPEMVGSRERVTAATGWQPRIPLEQTLADTLDWWRGRIAEPETR